MPLPEGLLVVGNDSAFVQSIGGHVRRILDRAPMSCRFDAVRQYLSPKTDGAVVLLAGQPADVPALRGLIQELQILQYRPRLVLLETPGAGVNGALCGLESHLAERRTWNDAKDIADVVRTHVRDGAGFFDPARASLEDRIAHRVLAYTPSLAPMVETLALAATHDVTVLLDGETGTGKTFLARLIHDCSPRAGNRCLVVPCGALAPNLIESEFFGHAKGSFTGADVAKVGKFAAVGQGTLLLDEIDALTMEHQANLLRVIETGEFEPVGSNETQITGARVIAATNWHLEEAVERGAFRRDLYYRLNVMAFHLPPLRERIEDIEPLVRSLVARFAIKFRKDLIRIHPDTLRTLEGFDWPGNIRQLENVVQQAVLLSSGPELVVKNLSPLVQKRCEPIYSSRPAAGMLLQNREAAERATIIRALEGAGYCRTRAAAALGISRVTLYKKMRAYGLLARPALTPIRPAESVAGA